MFYSTYYSVLILIFDNIKPRQLKTSLLEPRLNQSEDMQHLFLPSTSR